VLVDHLAVGFCDVEEAVTEIEVGVHEGGGEKF